MKCPKCQTENPEGMKFCSGCGSPLVEQRVSEPAKKGNGPLFVKALKALYMLAGAVVILFFISLSKYDTEVEQKWAICDGHCMEVSVEVTSPLTWVTDFEMEGFNLTPPCSYVKNKVKLPAHEPLSEANLQKFVNTAVDKYKEKVWVHIAMFGALTLLLYGLFYYYNKKNKSGAAQSPSAN